MLRSFEGWYVGQSKKVGMGGARVLVWTRACKIIVRNPVE